MKIVAIYDKKAMSFHPAFTVPNMVNATRSLDKAVNSQQGDFADYPQDFALYHLADYNELTGEISPLCPPALVHELQEFVKADN